MAADESTELWMLRAKAYGPGGGLSAEELARLQELEGREAAGGEGRFRLAPLAQPVSSAAASPPPLNDLRGEALHGNDPHGDHVRGTLSDRGETKRAERPQGVEAFEPAETSTAPEAPDSSTDSYAGPRHRWPLVAAASAAILAIGLGIGWGIWGEQNRSIPLTDEQLSWQETVLAEDDYDPGSAIAVREEEGVVVWVATQSAGEQTCLLISNGEESSAVCRDTAEAMSEGLWGELAIPDGSNENTTWFAQATIMFSAAGHPAARMDTYSTTTDGSSNYASDRDEEIADLLVDDGYMRSRLWVVGYFEGDPVWMGTPEGTVDEACLVYVAASDEPIADCMQPDPEAEDLVLDILDTTGQTPREIEMRYAVSPTGPMTLTVTVHPATGIVVDPETGDVVEGDPDDPAPDDIVPENPVIDDKTDE